MQGNDALMSIEYKNTGNKCLQIGQAEAAVEWYTKSINLVPTNPIVFCNRSVAYKKLSQFGKMYDDSV